MKKNQVSKDKNDRVQAIEKNEEQYVLTLGEYEKMTAAFYAVESTVRLLQETCSDRGDLGVENQGYLDVANCLGLVQEKLQIIGPMLHK